MANYRDIILRDFLAITNALADQNRVRAVLALRGRELCVCQITALLRLAPSTVSKHISILHHAALVEMRKDGRWIFYRLPKTQTPIVRHALQWACQSLQNSLTALDDSKRLKSILKIDPEEICRRQMAK